MCGARLRHLKPPARPGRPLKSHFKNFAGASPRTPILLQTIFQPPDLLSHTSLSHGQYHPFMSPCPSSPKLLGKMARQKHLKTHHPEFLNISIFWPVAILLNWLYFYLYRPAMKVHTKDLQNRSSWKANRVPRITNPILVGSGLAPIHDQIWSRIGCKPLPTRMGFLFLML